MGLNRAEGKLPTSLVALLEGGDAMLARAAAAAEAGDAMADRADVPLGGPVRHPPILENTVVRDTGERYIR